MKKILFLMIAAVCVVGCTKKNSPSPSAGVQIVGKWKLVKDEVKDYQNGAITLDTVITSNNNNVTQYIQFNVDGSGSANTSEGTMETFSYQLSVTTLTLNIPQQTIGQSTQAAYSETYTVNSLTVSSLITYFELSVSNSGQIIKDTNTLYYERQ